MQRLKRALRRVLFPGTAVVLIAAVLAAAGLYWAFAAAPEGSALVYTVYAFSFWALTIACVNAPGIAHRVLRRARRSRIIGQCLSDERSRLEAVLAAALAANLLYALINLALWLSAGTPWLLSLGVYYAILAAMRALLLRFAVKRGFDADIRAQWRLCRACGVLMAPVNIVLAGVVVLIMSEEGGFSYDGMLIYAAAAYAFYCVTAGIVNVVRSRRYRSPVMSASRMVSLASALVSMLALEVAMLAEFSTEDETVFRSTMIILTGFAVFVTLAAMGIRMTVRSSRAIKALSDTGGNYD